MKNLRNYLTALVVLAAPAAQAAPVTWADWSQFTPNTQVLGTIGGIGVTYQGLYSFVQTGAGTNYWTEPNPANQPYTGNAVIDNAPTPSEMIAIDLPATHTITFSQPILNPVMAIVSLGQPSLEVSYAFDTPFNLLSDGQGFWGVDPNGVNIVGQVLGGQEFHGAIQFSGLISSFSWTSSPNEFWHGITVGSVEAVPLPASLPLFAGGLGLLGLMGWRRQRAAA